LPKLIVGNKCDLRDERKVDSEEGRMLADENKCTFMEVSAKENINI
jgi:GTPase SAR1 family protein